MGLIWSDLYHKIHRCVMEENSVGILRKMHDIASDHCRPLKVKKGFFQILKRLQLPTSVIKTWTVYSDFSNRIGKISTGREHLETTTLASKKKRRKETATSEKNTTASTDKEEDTTTEQGTSTEATHNENKVMVSEKNPFAIFWKFLEENCWKKHL
jgi:hypothetical protein